jgi:N-acetylmuramoyl-L-alanine amidase
MGDIPRVRALALSFYFHIVIIRSDDEMKIMLDAGHHESTPGKQTVDGYKEHLFNEGVTNHAAQLLRGYQNVEVFFADDEHYDTPLSIRASKANNLNVDLFISAHANAFGTGTTWNSANGIETYVYQKTGEQLALAEKIQRNLVAATGLANRGVKAANFAVLRETNMTAVLVECGFMTNQREAGLIKTEAYQQTCAKAIVDAIAEQYRLTKNNVKNGWVLEAGNWFYYKDGNKQTGWIFYGNKWYYLDSAGVMKTGWVKVKEKWYFLDSSGAMKTGWLLNNGKWYYLNPNGDMATGVIQDKGKLYHLNPDGSMSANTTVTVTLKAGPDGDLRP